jgi:HK97 family phage prohead protease
MRIKGLPVVRSGILVPFRATDTDADAVDTTEGSETTEGTLGRLFVRFSPFNTAYEVNSWWEGRFIEHTEPGAFRKTISESKRSNGTFTTKVLFNHGGDLNIGDKVLAVADRMSEVNVDGYHGPELEGDLLDTSYNRDLLPGLKRDAYGSSFMFEVIRESWNNEPDPSDTNPEGLPERSIQEVRLFEAGPVTWPASPTASAGMRSQVLGRCNTDGWMERLQTRNGRRYDDLVRSFEAFRAMYKPAEYKPGTPTPESGPDLRRQVDEAAVRAASIRARRLALMKVGY